MRPYEDMPTSVFNEDKIMDMIDSGMYFVIYGPRKSMRTSFLRALEDKLNDDGGYSCVRVSARGLVLFSEGDPVKVQTLLAANINSALPTPIYSEDLWLSRPSTALFDVLQKWSSTVFAEGKRAVLLIDDYDSLKSWKSDDPLDDTVDTTNLESLLEMLRAGCLRRPRLWPASVVLCGFQDLCSIEKEPGVRPILQDSPFNIAFTEQVDRQTRGFRLQDIRAIYDQWAEQEDLEVSEEAVKAVMRWTGGHPWLVNRFGYILDQPLSKSEGGGVTIEAKDVDEAGYYLVENWVLLKQADRLFLPLYHHLKRDAGLRRTVSNALGETVPIMDADAPNKEDLAVSLGLLKWHATEPRLVPANETYARMLPETILRIRAVAQGLDTERWGWEFLSDDDQSIDWDGLLDDFLDTCLRIRYGKGDKLNELQVRNDLFAYLRSAWNSGRRMTNDGREGDTEQTGINFVDSDGKTIEVLEVKVRPATNKEWRSAAKLAACHAKNHGDDCRATVFFLDNGFPLRYKSSYTKKVVDVDGVTVSMFYIHKEIYF